MPAKPLTAEQKEDAARLKEFFKAWQASMREAGKPVSQDAAAAKLGFGQSALSQYLNGSIPLNGQVLAKFAGLMDIPPDLISPSVASAESQRAEKWGLSESALELLAVQTFAMHGIEAEYARTLAPHGRGMPEWLLRAAGDNSKFFPDLRLKMPDGSEAWAEIKSPRAYTEVPFLTRLTAQHPREFVLLAADSTDLPVLINHWLTQRDTSPAPSPQQDNKPAPEHRHEMKNRRPVWVVGMSQGGMTERIWTDGDYPVGALEEWADVSTTDEHAFACRVVGDSMVPRYMPGEYALVEPNTAPELEDDVLVRLASGQTMLKRLLSRRGGIRLGSYNSAEVMSFREDEVTWMYYVAHPIPTRRIRQRVDLDTQQEAAVRLHDVPVAVEKRESATRMGGDAPPAAAKKPRARSGS